MKKERTFSNAQHKALDGNEFIEEVIGDKIIYTKDFYIVMYKKMEYEKKSAIEAYESMGFDTKLFGKNRAYKAAQRTKTLIKDGQYLVNPYNYDGSASRESMGTLTPQQEAAYYKARTIYLERVVAFQKKIPSIVEQVNSSLKNEN